MIFLSERKKNLVDIPSFGVRSRVFSRDGIHPSKYLSCVDRRKSYKGVVVGETLVGV
jgi:hypothetical protein